MSELSKPLLLVSAAQVQFLGAPAPFSLPGTQTRGLGPSAPGSDGFYP